MPMPLGQPFEDALVFAFRRHQVEFSQVRTGTEVTYVAHVLPVAALALEQGADEEVAIAALLHDVVEDCGGLPVLEEIRALFGPRVADLVLECTDAITTPKLPWQVRKDAYLAHLAHATPGARLIALCDKLHNAQSVVRDLKAQGPSVWKRFKASPEASLWYYRSVVSILSAQDASPLLEELRATVEELSVLIGQGGA